jgi:hypothetical protein
MGVVAEILATQFVCLIRFKQVIQQPLLIKSDTVFFVLRSPHHLSPKV